ncbi:MAG: 30S ribosomal protein S2 [Planctomycetes bacterium]|nr:30S ribosomal protein S2 [Planctomycetota bacterium]
MAIVSIKDLVGSGVHFGHRVSRWNPKMKPYIFGKRNLIHIIDLKATVRGLVAACNFVKRVAARGGMILFVGTKRQAKNVVEAEAKRCNMPYANERWIGGTLTNYKTIHARLQRLLQLEAMQTDGTLERYGKKERSQLLRELRKLKRNLDGIRTMDKLPAAMFIVDVKREKNALQEARKMGVPTIALIDTDGDPDLVDIRIPGNDDAMRVIQIVSGKMAEAITEGRKDYVPPPERPVEAVSFGRDMGRRGGRDTGRRPGGGPRREERGPSSAPASAPAPAPSAPAAPAAPPAAGGTNPSAPPPAAGGAPQAPPPATP